MNGKNETEDATSAERTTKLSRDRDVFVSRLFGSTGGFLALLIPVIYFWITSSEKVSLAQIAVATEQVRVTTEQVAYITKRMHDSDKERDLYKLEMLACQKELRERKK